MIMTMTMTAESESEWESESSTRQRGEARLGLAGWLSVFRHTWWKGRGRVSRSGGDD